MEPEGGLASNPVGFALWSPHRRAAEALASSGVRALQRAIGIAAGLTAIFALAFWHVESFPAAQFDEGAHVEAARILATTGRFARLEEASGSAQSVGPTVSVPVALALRCCGTSLRSVRLVMATYLAGAILMWYLLARQLGAPRFAVASVAFLVVDPSLDLVTLGRQVMGEVPGLFYLAAGLCLWFSQWHRPSARWLAVAGCLLGLSAITKPQYLLLIGGGLTLACLVNLVYWRSRWLLFIVPTVCALSCAAVWYAIYFHQSPDPYAEIRELIRAGTSIGFLVSRSIAHHAINDFVRPSSIFYSGWLVPALGYIAFLAFTRDHDQRWSVLWLFAIVNLAWFTQSIGWLRYAFAGVAMGSLMVARCFDDLTSGFRIKWPRAGADSTAALQLGLSIWVLVLVIPYGKDVVRNVVRPPVNAASVAASQFGSLVPPGEVVETFEAQMPVLVPSWRFHMPPPRLQETAILHRLGQAPAAFAVYSPPQNPAPRFLLLGPFGRSAQVYSPDVLNRSYQLRARAGEYDLYERRDIE